jgi:uncharacterized membrane protein YjjP (DUF1212 family)
VGGQSYAVPDPHPPRSQRLWREVQGFARRRSGEPEVRPEPVPGQLPEAVLDLLRNLGVAMCDAGDSVDRVTLILDQVASAYGATGVRFFVLPTGVFVRIDTGVATRVDFALGASHPLRLDQVDGLYRLVDDITHRRVDVDVARERLRLVRKAEPRFGPVRTVLATGVLTVGLGLMLNPALQTLPVFFVLGALVGVLKWWSERSHVLALVLSVATAFAVTWVAFDVVGPWLGSSALDIVIPSLVILLPGAALTMATVELSSGSMVAGSTRLVYGLERLLLLSFGIAAGAQLAGVPGQPGEALTRLGPWAPWVGVLVFGLGQYIASSAPKGSLRWLLLVLYVAYAVQVVAGQVLGGLGASFLAGAVIAPVAYFVQRRHTGPPVLVTFLPAFWLLVPGALGLEGVTKIVAADQVSGLGDFVNALLAIVAIALGVLVGAGLADRRGRGAAL